MTSQHERFPRRRADGSFCVSARFEARDEGAAFVGSVLDRWIRDKESDFPGHLADDMGGHPQARQLDGVMAVLFDCDADSRLWKGWMVEFVSLVTSESPELDVETFQFLGFFDEVSGRFHAAAGGQPGPRA